MLTAGSGFEFLKNLAVALLAGKEEVRLHSSQDLPIRPGTDGHAPLKQLRGMAQPQLTQLTTDTDRESLDPFAGHLGPALRAQHAHVRTAVSSQESSQHHEQREGAKEAR